MFPLARTCTVCARRDSRGPAAVDEQGDLHSRIQHAWNAYPRDDEQVKIAIDLLASSRIEDAPSITTLVLKAIEGISAHSSTIDQYPVLLCGAAVQAPGLASALVAQLRKEASTEGPVGFKIEVIPDPANVHWIDASCRAHWNLENERIITSHDYRVHGVDIVQDFALGNK